MLRLVLLKFLLIIAMCSNAEAQQKMPAISFEEKSIVFANGNVQYRLGNEGTEVDTLLDQSIIHALAKILNDHPELQVEVAGHTAINEQNDLGRERAELVKKLLSDRGVETARMLVVNYAHEEPLIDQDQIFSFPTAEEKRAANAKNRRVEIRVVSNEYNHE